MTVINISDIFENPNFSSRLLNSGSHKLNHGKTAICPCNDEPKVIFCCPCFLGWFARKITAIIAPTQHEADLPYTRRIPFRRRQVNLSCFERTSIQSVFITFPVHNWSLPLSPFHFSSSRHIHQSCPLLNERIKAI